MNSATINDKPTDDSTVVATPQPQQPEVLDVIMFAREYAQLHNHIMNNFTAMQALPLLQFLDALQQRARINLQARDAELGATVKRVVRGRNKRR